MKHKIMLAIVVIGFVVGAVSLIRYKTSAGFFKDRSQTELRWETLGLYDYEKSIAPEELKKLDGQFIKIPGFMVPLEDNQKKITEFLLVPNPQACIHVPPPPPNQMLLAQSPSGVDVAYGPIWVHAIFRIKSMKHQYGEASFELEVKFVEPYL